MCAESIIEDLISKWVSISREYAGTASGVSAYYVYGLDERVDGTGIRYTNVVYEQNGVLVFKHRLVGAETGIGRQRQLTELMIQDLTEASEGLQALSVPAPTEYRVRYETGSGKVDVKLSYDAKVHGHSDLTPQDALALWLGDRAPRP